MTTNTNNVKGMLIVGTHPQIYINGFEGPILAMDTLNAVTQLPREKVHAIHLRLDRNKEIPNDVPSKLLLGSGDAGAALKNTLSYFILNGNKTIEEIIQKFLSKLYLCIILISSGGGTGNGGYPVILDMIRGFRLSNRLLYIHEIDPVVNSEKQWCRLRALYEKGTTNELHIICKDSQTVRDLIKSITPEDFDQIKGVLVNINAKNSNGSMFNALLCRALYLTHSDLIVNVEKIITSRIINRWREGRKDVSEDEINEGLKQLQTHCYKLMEEHHVDHSRVLKLLNGSSDQFKEAIKLHIQDNVLEFIPRIEKNIKAVQKCILSIGLKNATPVIQNIFSQLAQNSNKHKEQISKIDWNVLLNNLVKIKRSVLHRILWKLNLNGTAIHTFNKVLNNELNFRCLNFIESLLQQRSVNLFGQSKLEGKLESINDFFDNSQILVELQELYLDKMIENPQTAQISLRKEAEKNLSKIIFDFVVKNLESQIFDFEVTQEVKNTIGIYILSKYSENLSQISRYIHCNMGNVKTQYSPLDVTKLYVFAPIQSIHYVPAIADMFMVNEAKYQDADDRSLYATNINDLIPKPRLHEKPGIPQDQVPIILLKAFITPNCLEVYRKRSNHIDIQFPPPIGRKSYSTADMFAKSLSFEEELLLHQNFSSFFKSNRRLVINQLENMLQGSIGTGERAERFKAMKNFVGATNWEKALKVLLDQTQAADLYFEERTKI